MTDRMRTLPLDDLLDWAVIELESQGAIFGIPKELFFVPRGDEPYATDLFEHRLATPIGPAAGPHTQLAQNIVAAWLCGGRFIELKTVQILDELAIPRPCIDMEDEGYNVEWSQELRLSESLDEYVKAWILVHILPRVLGFERAPFGTVFNASVGYTLEGILAPAMRQFMDRLENAESEIASARARLRPEYADIETPSRIVNSVTLSTMHGCPPDEIETIARYLLEERGLHTTVKLNPTLLGRERVLRILHDDLGYRSIDIPERIFEQDLQYDRAVELIRSLQSAAAACSRTFVVKLSNTLATSNRRGVLPGDEAYMSGRALFPITINLFHRLVDDLDGDLNVSYSAGADAANLPDLLAAGALPVTVASDLLRPGGCGRLAQYLENLEAQMAERGARDLGELASRRRERLEALAHAALEDPRYRKAYRPYGLPKVESRLTPFDCIEAPCVAQCAVCQDVPEYAHWLACGDDDRALAAILHRNPFPGVTGYVCTERCRTRCTRNAYDEAVAIRQLKRFAAEQGSGSLRTRPRTGRRVAVIGAGPSGLAAACFLAESGIDVTVFEAKDRAGGMLAIAPAFRLPAAIVREDIERIEALGVTIECGCPVDVAPEALLADGYDAVHVACGFSADAIPEQLEGTDARGVYGALAFLEQVACGEPPALGGRVIIIGGGNTAIDAARTAQRLTGRPATVVYRRSRAEMPAEADEIDALLAEGNKLIELAAPIRVEVEDGRAVGLRCERNELGPAGDDGRPRPIPIEGSGFTVPADAILVATGQRSDAGFLARSAVHVDGRGAIPVDGDTGRTVREGIYAGGDIARGPATIIEACADGRRAARSICAALGVPFDPPGLPTRAVTAEDVRSLKVARARTSGRRRPQSLPPESRLGFDLVEATLAQADARAEAERCLQCHLLCDRCVEVCPNRANLAVCVPTVDVMLPLFTFGGGAFRTVGEERVTIAQERQILHIDDWCNACGNCATFCTHDGKPYLDKPRFFLNRHDYEMEQDNAFLFDRGVLYRRDGGRESRLRRVAAGYAYDAPHVRAWLAPSFDLERAEPRAPFEGTISLRPAVEAAVLLVGIVETAAYLPKAAHSGGKM